MDDKYLKGVGMAVYGVYKTLIETRMGKECAGKSAGKMRARLECAEKLKWRWQARRKRKGGGGKRVSEIA
jgi:hypothetical protein